MSAGLSILSIVSILSTVDVSAGLSILSILSIVDVSAGLSILSIVDRCYVQRIFRGRALIAAFW